MIRGQRKIRGIRDRIQPGFLIGKALGAASALGHSHPLSPSETKAFLRYIDAEISNTSKVAGDTVPDAINTLSNGSNVTIEIVIISAEGRLTNAENLPFVTISKAITIPAGFTGAVGYAETAPTADATFNIQQNGVNVGTVKFAAGSHTPSFTAGSPIVLSAGDRLAPIGPTPADATLSDVSVTIQGTRS